ncbi:MAG: replication protein [Oscillospiraceae bacterium]|nr:replication protein [Oscillospiraceae bacterium]
MYKKRYWLAVVYPESMPEDWKEKLSETHLPCAVSPLHDKDYNADGEIKKAHYHILLAYDGPTTQRSVASMLAPLNGPLPQGCESVRGAYRYLTHEDNPEKAQYDTKDILLFNGFNPEDYCELTKTEVLSIIRRIQCIVDEQHFCRMSDLGRYLVDNDMIEEYSVLTTHTYYLQCYLNGVYQQTQGTLDGKK